MFIQGSRLRINLAKTSLIGLNIGSAKLVAKVARIGCSTEALPFHYLGLPLGGNHRAIAFWRPLVEKGKLQLTK